MNKCILFSASLDENGCICLVLTPNGEVITPPEFQTFEKIKALQVDCDTMVVESAVSVCLLHIPLSWLPVSKARIAIPYAVEDKVAQPIEELHFCFDREHFQNNQYLVAVISKQRMQFIMDTLREHTIKFESITCDWFALNENEVVVSDDKILIHRVNFQGGLVSNLALNYLADNPGITPIVFENSKLMITLQSQVETMHSYVWLAQRLSQATPMNFCQGEMIQGSDSNWLTRGYQLVGVLACVWLVSLILVNGLKLHSVNKQTVIVDAQIEKLYKKFFPEAKQVINPKFRVQQLLGGANGEAQMHFWFLFNQLTKSMEKSSLVIEQMAFQNKQFLVTIQANDFKSLEELENKLKQLQVQVKQTQAATHAQKVVATLELT